MPFSHFVPYFSIDSEFPDYAYSVILTQGEQRTSQNGEI